MKALKPRANYGITRIDQPEKKNHGFYVRITHRGQSNHKYFPDKSSGGREAALKRARQHRDEILATLPDSKQEAAARKPRKIFKSGVKGVTHVISRTVKGKVYEYWQAAWTDGNGKRETAKYSFARYGEKQALELAKEAMETLSRIIPPKKTKKTGRKRK
jgi:hypothetical protein